MAPCFRAHCWQDGASRHWQVGARALFGLLTKVRSADEGAILKDKRIYEGVGESAVELRGPRTWKEAHAILLEE